MTDKLAKSINAVERALVIAAIIGLVSLYAKVSAMEAKQGIIYDTVTSMAKQVNQVAIIAAKAGRK